MMKNPTNEQEMEEQSWLVYSSCIHENKYKFKDNSPLEAYLRTKCHGFVQDSVKMYNINYILIILLSNWKYYKLIHDRTIKTTIHIRRAFKLSRAKQNDVIHSSQLRKMVVEQLDAPVEMRFLKEVHCFYTWPFWCLSESSIRLVNSITLEHLDKGSTYVSFWHRQICK